MRLQFFLDSRSNARREFAVIQPPSRYTRASYLDPFIASAGGSIQNPDAASGCLYCSDGTADAWLYRSFNIQYAHRWRSVGLSCAFIAFNVCFWFTLWR